MYSSSDLKKGLKFELDGAPHIVMNFDFVKPGKGKSFYKCKLKNMLTGSQFEKNFREVDKFPEADVQDVFMEYLYSDKDGYHFMNNQTYDQVTLQKAQIDELLPFLKENTLCNVIFYKDKAISITLPTTLELKIVSTEPWAKGNSATKDMKPAKLETGATIQVPPFIEEGEIIKVDTRTGSYMERVKK